MKIEGIIANGGKQYIWEATDQREQVCKNCALRSQCTASNNGLPCAPFENEDGIFVERK